MSRSESRPPAALTRAQFLRLCAAAGGMALLPARLSAAADAGRMSTRPIPSTGEALPVVGVGTWQVFDVGPTEEERAPLRDVLRLLFDAGGAMIDSSPMYGPAESVVGDLLAALDARDRAFLATKVWTDGRERGIAQMRQSMSRFRADAIDLMQVHNLVDWRTHLKTLAEWKEAGTVRYTGITHYTESAFGDLARIMETERIDFVQLPYSIGVRGAEDRLLPLAAERGIAVIVNRPYEGGAVFRAARRGRSLPPWTAEFDCASWGQFFLKYILSHPAVTCVIPGTGRIDHLRDNIAAGMGRLPDGNQRRRMAGYFSEL
ncbi:MAG: aldo/keto reductase [Alphaproteobacteria bacterium]|nr:aldo/keto reductase [Alphaproteobacteria bacterium]